MNVFEKFLAIMKKEAKEHREIAEKFRQEFRDEKRRYFSDRILEDTKYHDGMADMANKLLIDFKLHFSKELSPQGLLDNIDDGVDLDKE